MPYILKYMACIFYDMPYAFLSKEMLAKNERETGLRQPLNATQFSTGFY